jgi:hypothetical protein
MNSEVLDKIRKLLRLGQSSNPHEAALAIQRAFEIASRHNIELTSIDLEEEERRIVHEYIRVGSRLSLERKLVLNIVLNYFNVNVVSADSSRGDVCFIGLPSDIEIAKYVFEFLVWSCRDGLKRYQKEQPRKLSRTKRENFIAGFVYGVRSQLRSAKEQLQIEESKTALVIAAEQHRQEYQDQLYPQTKEIATKLSRLNDSALMTGFAHGEKTSISPAVGAAAVQTRLLT